MDIVKAFANNEETEEINIQGTYEAQQSLLLLL